MDMLMGLFAKIGDLLKGMFSWISGLFGGSEDAAATNAGTTPSPSQNGPQQQTAPTVQPSATLAPDVAAQARDAAQNTGTPRYNPADYGLSDALPAPAAVGGMDAARLR